MKAGNKATVHDCRLNHSASSKAMEPQAAIDLFTRSLKSNVELLVYTGDDGSTTAAHIKQKVPYPVEKCTDIVHAKRSLSTRLYNLAQRGKFANSSVLSQRVKCSWLLGKMFQLRHYSKQRKSLSPSKRTEEHRSSRIWRS